MGKRTGFSINKKYLQKGRWPKIRPCAFKLWQHHISYSIIIICYSCAIPYCEDKSSAIYGIADRDSRLPDYANLGDKSSCTYQEFPGTVL